MFHLSLIAPAKTLKSTYGVYEQTIKSAVFKAEPSNEYDQTTSAKAVIALPSPDSICVNHKMR